MACVEILEDLFFIERGYLNANHFVYRGQGPVLVDTGYVSDFEETERLIQSLGVNLSDTRLIVNTHTHCDHIGGNKRIQEKSGCDIALHRIGKHFIDTRDDWSTWWRYYDQKADFFHCTQPLRDGDTVTLGQHEFQVIYTPGHAADGIVLYHPEEKILLSSDTLWENDTAVMTLRVEGSRALFFHLEALERLSRLHVKKVYPGHGRAFSDAGQAIWDARAKTEDFLAHPDKLGTDLLKKIIIYTLMMLREIQEDLFFEHLMGTVWFKETIDLYFNGEYASKYDDVMHGLFGRGLVRRKGDKIYTIVKR